MQNASSWVFYLVKTGGCVEKGFCYTIPAIREPRSSRHCVDGHQEVVSEEGPESLSAECFWSKYEKYAFHKDVVFDGTPYHTVGTRNVPPAYAEVDVKLNDNGEEIDSFMLAGMVGMQVSSSGDQSLSSNGENDTVRPVAGWWICVKKQNVISAQEEEEEEARMAKRMEERKEKLRKELQLYMLQERMSCQ
ncbi:hypothetical protein FB45DRAFT_1097301 [Roridomyces roridus]|uniref:Uncharacterized protein n=1 Tax=Roridomyces roridus TaxID=1738132 RepID=A0AAD7FE72_9AGAR|nr:hypothetical protein FB45DRAFT_1097301 [Roridomyces roridus]